MRTNPITTAEPPSAPASTPAPRAALAGVIAALAIVLIACVAGLVYVLSQPTPIDPTSARPGIRRDDAAQAALDSARALVTQGDFPKALAILDRVIPTFPADQDLRLVHAQALIGSGQFAPAYDAIAAAIAIGPALPQIHFDAGTIANRAGLTDKAEQHYSLAQKADPANPAYPLYLAMIQIKQGHDAAAMGSLLRVVKLDDSIAEAWGTMGELQLRAARPAVAADQFARAMKLQPSLARWRLGAARAALAQNQPDQAESLLAGLDPRQREDPAARALIDQLRAPRASTPGG